MFFTLLAQIKTIGFENHFDFGIFFESDYKIERKYTEQQTQTTFSNPRT